MSEQYSWDAGQQGIILSAFFAGYICTQLLGGGPRVVRWGRRGPATRAWGCYMAPLGR